MLELELSVDIDYADCTDAQKEAITVLAAICALLLDWRLSFGFEFSGRRRQR